MDPETISTRSHEPHWMAFFETVKGSSNPLAGSIGLALCFCAAEAWRFPVVTADALESWNPWPSSSLFDPGLPNVLITLATLLMLVVLASRYLLSIRNPSRKNTVTILVAALISLSLYAHFSAGPIADSNIVLYYLSRLHMPLSMALLVIWFEEICNQRNCAMAVLAAAFFFTFCMQASLGLLMPPIAKGTCAILPILSALFLIIYRRQIVLPTPFGPKPDPKDGGERKRIGKGEGRALVPTGIIFFSCGMIFSYLHTLWYYSSATPWSSMVIQIASATGSLLACIVLIGAFPGKRSGIFEVAILAFALLALYLSTFAQDSIVTVFYLAPLNAAQKLMYALLLAVSLRAADTRISMAMLCILLACYRTGLSILGMLTVAGSLIPLFSSESSYNLLLVIAVAYLVFTSLRNIMLPETPSQPPVSPSEKDERKLIEKYKDMAFFYYFGQKNDLTRREIEILPLLLDMKNASAIAEELVISQMTAKSHLRNIYAKLDAHSQKEVVDLIVQERARFS